MCFSPSSTMGEEQTLGDSKTLICGESEEIPLMEENPLPQTMEIENPSPDFVKSDEVLGGWVAETLESEEVLGMEENPLAMDSCNSGGVVVAQLTETLDFGGNLGNVESENPVLDSCKSGEILSGIVEDDDVQVVEILGEVSETEQFQNSVSDCCEIGGITGVSLNIDDAHVAKTLEEASLLAKTQKEFIEGGVAKDEDEMISVDELIASSVDFGNSCDDNGVLDVGCSSQGKDSDFGGVVGSLSQYYPTVLKRCDPPQCSEKNSGDCGCGSGGEDDEGQRHKMALPLPRPHPYLTHPDFPFPDYHSHTYRNRDHYRRRRFSESEHHYRMMTDDTYRMYHESGGRTERPYCMEEEADCYQFYGPSPRNSRRGFRDSDSGWSPYRPSRWSEPEPCPVGAGLSNLGNTCFLNAIMQCFTHTVPLVEGLQLLKHEDSSHGQGEFCVLCAVRNQIEQSLASSGSIISPYNLVDNLKHFSSFFQRYQQEDAHEFLQCLVDKLDSNWGQRDSDAGEQSSSHESLVKQVFGGRLVSQLRCSKCGHNSDCYEPVNDLSLEIEDVDDLESAFKSFMKVENLEDTAECDGCKEKVQMEKQLLLDQAPPVAALHLKRFKSAGIYIEKIDRMVKYPLELDLGPYTKGARHDNEDLKYELYGIVVHVGLSSNSGHYFSYIRTSPDAWYRFDDSKVTKVSEESALDQEAYILFYARKGTPWFSDLLEKWKENLAEKSNTSPKSVLDSTNLQSTSVDVGAILLGCHPSDTKDADSVTYAEPLSCRKLDETEIEIEKEDPVAAQDSEVANINVVSSNNPVQENFAADKAEVDVQVSAGASSCCNEPSTSLSHGEDIEGEKRRGATGVTSVERCCVSKVGNFIDVPIYDVETNRSTSPASPDIYADKEPAAERTYQIPTAHLKVPQKASSGKKVILGKSKQDLEKKEAEKYLKSSRMTSGRRNSLLAMVVNTSPNKKRRNNSSWNHKPSPKKRVKIGPKRTFRTVAASV